MVTNISYLCEVWILPHEVVLLKSGPSDFTSLHSGSTDHVFALYCHTVKIKMYIFVTTQEEIDVSFVNHPINKTTFTKILFT